METILFPNLIQRPIYEIRYKIKFKATDIDSNFIFIPETLF